MSSDNDDCIFVQWTRPTHHSSPGVLPQTSSRPQLKPPTIDLTDSDQTSAQQTSRSFPQDDASSTKSGPPAVNQSHEIHSDSANATLSRNDVLTRVQLLYSRNEDLSEQLILVGGLRSGNRQQKLNELTDILMSSTRSIPSKVVAIDIGERNFALCVVDNTTIPPSITSWSIHDLQLDLRSCAASELGMAVGRLVKSNIEPHLTDKTICGIEQQQLFRKQAPKPPRKTWASTITKISADLVAIESCLYSLLSNTNVVSVIPDKMLTFWGISNRQPSSKASKSNSGSSENNEDHENIGVGRGRKENRVVKLESLIAAGQRVQLSDGLHDFFKTQRKKDDLADAALYALCLLEWQVNVLRLKREVGLE
ncbi:hypothetical protein SeMB42_g01907 [Synchytrium endobioticum]|uniref:Mitochondrial resolvase Ydc2 catalytic domain-containing protein n=1 Tax=Synchytrium endobioticum TaxID=286115 RepID=A0A507DIU4_9FUNG|nr:hypothetical protein SeMB42_g01907 [Synchytrium endobioticum]